MSEPGGVPEAGWWGIAAALLALIGGPAAIGKAVKWWAERSEKRRASRAEGNREWEAKLIAWDHELKERERAITSQLQEGLAECKRECEAVREESDKVREDNRVVILALGVALPKLAQAAPATAELGVIRSLLLTRFRLDPNTPAEVTALLALLDHKTS
jgi:hypothetical protein